MKNLVLILFALFIVSSCSKDKDCPAVEITAPASEVANLRAYLSANSITATEDSRGFFYVIHNAGTGTKPTPCDNVNITYTGKLTTGGTFDSGTATFYLGSLISGWQEGLPLIGEAGVITLYLPPSLAYGSSAVGSIPPNSNLIFDITLHGVY